MDLPESDKPWLKKKQFFTTDFAQSIKITLSTNAIRPFLVRTNAFDCQSCPISKILAYEDLY